MEFSERLKTGFADYILEAEEADRLLRIESTPPGWLEVCKWLRDEGGFDYPADFTAWDTGEQIIVWLRLYGIESRRTATVRTTLSREEPRLTSLTGVWPGVDWHEREVFDLYGVQFTGHPDADDPSRMRILLPEDWEGHPFRKDYEPVFAGNPLHGPQETN